MLKEIHTLHKLIYMNIRRKEKRQAMGPEYQRLRKLRESKRPNHLAQSRERHRRARVAKRKTNKK